MPLRPVLDLSLDAGPTGKANGQHTFPPALASRAVRRPTSPVLVAHGEQPGLVGQLGQQAAALHHDGLGDHDDTRHNPYDDDALAGPLSRALKHQRMADGVPAVQGDAAQREH